MAGDDGLECGLEQSHREDIEAIRATMIGQNVVCRVLVELPCWEESERVVARSCIVFLKPQEFPTSTLTACGFTEPKQRGTHGAAFVSGRSIAKPTFRSQPK